MTVTELMVSDQILSILNIFSRYRDSNILMNGSECKRMVFVGDINLGVVDI